MSVQAHNKHDTRIGKKQPSGVALLVAPCIQHFVLETGQDTSDMGRWVWADFKGANGTILCVYQIY